MERLALEFSSLPDREMVPEGSDSAAGQQQQLTTPGCKSSLPRFETTTPYSVSLYLHELIREKIASSQITPTSNTPTNNLITKTIRAAMSDINKPK